VNKEFFNKIIAKSEAYLADNRITTNTSAKDLEAHDFLNLPDKPQSTEKLLADIDQYYKYSVKTHTPYFMNQLWTGFSQAGLTAEIIATTSNTSMYTYEVAPVATLIEKDILQTMGQLYGYNYTEGTFTPGASYANMLGLLLARNHVFKDSKINGLGDAKPVLFVSKVGHYSSFKAANQLGIGEANVIEVETNKHDQMLPDDLNKKIEAAVKAGKSPFAVIATAGTTVRSSFDPLDEISAVCRAHKLWFHVDGALGASCIFSNKEKHRLKGIEKSDSLTWNAHKMLGVPLHCSLFLTSVENGLSTSNKLSSDKTSYIFRAEENPNLGPISLQCGRKVDALKLWLAWKEEGTTGFEKRVDTMFEMADYATKAIKKDEKLYLTYETTGPNVCFQYKPDPSMSTKNTNELNLDIRTKLLHEGDIAINFGYVNDDLCIRMVNFHNKLNTEVIDNILKAIIKTGDELTN